MYVYYNPNPNMAHEDDCVVRAIAKATGTDWDTAYMMVVTEGFEQKTMPSINKVWGSKLRKLGFTRHIIPNICPDCYTIEDFCKDHPRGLYIVATGSHVVTVVDGRYFDTWDSGKEVPIYYFERGE